MTPMLSISPNQIMHLWEELIDASHGCNGYGGDTAEVYVYRFMQHSPSVVLDRIRHGQGDKDVSDGYREDYLEAASALHALCRLFEERRGVTIEMAEGPLDSLLGPQTYDHRVHLKVIKA
jgi:hypothetical protein